MSSSSRVNFVGERCEVTKVTYTLVEEGGHDHRLVSGVHSIMIQQTVTIQLGIYLWLGNAASLLEAATMKLLPEMFFLKSGI